MTYKYGSSWVCRWRWTARLNPQQFIQALAYRGASRVSVLASGCVGCLFRVRRAFLRISIRAYKHQQLTARATNYACPRYTNVVINSSAMSTRDRLGDAPRDSRRVTASRE